MRKIEIDLDLSFLEIDHCIDILNSFKFDEPEVIKTWKLVKYHIRPSFIKSLESPITKIKFADRKYLLILTQNTHSYKSISNSYFP